MKNLIIDVPFTMRLREPFELERDDQGTYYLHNYRNLDSIFLGDADGALTLLSAAIAGIKKSKKLFGS